jgi:NAD(P)-dependent dehydrogenase (short-subunit alcohol dehydrogenase family)
VARAQEVIASFPAATAAGQRHLAVEADVLDRPSLEAAAAEVTAAFGRVDGLVNGAGGNDARATTAPERAFFDLPAEALRDVVGLNLLGTMLPSQVFGRLMAAQREGVILNVSSVSADRPLTRVAGYAAAKAGVDNFTRWLAVHLAAEHGPGLRVNAIMPGFFLTEQNRFLLTDRDTGALTARGEKVLAHTPLGRFGAPEDLVGAAVWLLSPASRFVTGAVVPIDGGFTASAGV